MGELRFSYAQRIAEIWPFCRAHCRCGLVIFPCSLTQGNRGHGVLRRMVKCGALFSGFSGIPRVRERLSDGIDNSAHSLSMTRAELSRQNPFGGAIYLAHGPVAQRLEQGTHNLVFAPRDKFTPSHSCEHE